MTEKTLSDKMEKVISEIENKTENKLSDKDYCWLINKVTDLWMLNKEFIQDLKEGNDLKIKNIDLKLDWIAYRTQPELRFPKPKDPEPQIRWLRLSQTLEGLEGSKKLLIQQNKEIDNLAGKEFHSSQLVGRHLSKETTSKTREVNRPEDKKPSTIKLGDGSDDVCEK